MLKSFLNLEKYGEQPNLLDLFDFTVCYTGTMLVFLSNRGPRTNENDCDQGLFAHVCFPSTMPASKYGNSGFHLLS